MTYTIVINGQRRFSSNPTIRLNGCFISNPSHEQILEAGWEVWIPPQVEPQPLTEPDEIDIMLAVKRMLASSVVELSDEEALSVAALYPTWISKMGKQVNAGERLWYNEKLYKVVQGHIVQEDWTPDVTQALYTEVSIEEIPAWVQPVGSTGLYMTGDKVKHNGLTWESLIDNNSWEPGAVGTESLWKQI